MLCCVPHPHGRCHIILANLRKPGEKAYKIPTGFLFDYITCANYTAEIWGWILFTIGTRTLASAFFTAAGAFQMAEWARGKHRRLQKVGRAGKRLCFERCCCLLLYLRARRWCFLCLSQLIALGCFVVVTSPHLTCSSCLCLLFVIPYSCLMARRAAPSTPSAGSCSHPCCEKRIWADRDTFGRTAAEFRGLLR